MQKGILASKMKSMRTIVQKKPSAANTAGKKKKMNLIEKESEEALFHGTSFIAI